MTDSADREHAARLYESYGPSVMATCLALLGSREDAADATHEVFARALPVLSDVRYPRAWLQTAARHHCMDVVRRRRLAERVATPEWSRGAEERDPATVVEQRQLAATTMAALPDRERRVLGHVFLEDRPVGRAASLMGMSYAATVQLLSRARRRAAQVAQLPSALVTPKLSAVGHMLSRLSLPGGSTAAGALPRGSLAGGALVLCFSLVCSAPRVAPPERSQVAAPGRVQAQAESAPPPLLPPVSAPRVVSSLLTRTGTQLRQSVARATAHPQPPSCLSTHITPPMVVWTDSSTTSTSPTTPYSPSLHLTLGTIALNGSVLVVRIHVADMEKQVPLGYQGLQWTMEWTWTQKYSQTYAARANYSPSAGMAFSVGVPGYPSTPVTGALVTGPQGYAEIDVPLALVGAPPLGAVLQQLVGFSEALPLDGPPTLETGDSDFVSSQHDYRIGQGCV